MTTLDDIVDFIVPKRVLVAAPYACGHEVLFLHLTGQTRRTAGWVLPSTADCKRMGLEPVPQDGYLLVRIEGDFESDLPAHYDRVNWICCDFALGLPLDPDSLSAIADFNRISRLDRFLKSINQTERKSPCP